MDDSEERLTQNQDHQSNITTKRSIIDEELGKSRTLTTKKLKNQLTKNLYFQDEESSIGTFRSINDNNLGHMEKNPINIANGQQMNSTRLKNILPDEIELSLENALLDLCRQRQLRYKFKKFSDNV